MTKQEEIGEMLEGLFEPEYAENNLLTANELAHIAMKMLSDRGVVLKVDREHNVHDNSGCACETCSIVRAVKAGYSAWEPLMEEKE